MTCLWLPPFSFSLPLSHTLAPAVAAYVSVPCHRFGGGMWVNLWHAQEKKNCPDRGLKINKSICPSLPRRVSAKETARVAPACDCFGNTQQARADLAECPFGSFSVKAALFFFLPRFQNFFPGQNKKIIVPVCPACVCFYNTHARTMPLFVRCVRSLCSK